MTAVWLNGSSWLGNDVIECGKIFFTWKISKIIQQINDTTA